MKITKRREEKYIEQIIKILDKSESPMWTKEIAEEMGRDDEMVKRLLLKLSDEGKVIKIKQKKPTVEYFRRKKWMLNTEETQ